MEGIPTWQESSTTIWGERVVWVVDSSRIGNMLGYVQEMEDSPEWDTLTNSLPRNPLVIDYRWSRLVYRTRISGAHARVNQGSPCFDTYTSNGEGRWSIMPMVHCGVASHHWGRGGDSRKECDKCRLSSIGDYISCSHALELLVLAYPTRRRGSWVPLRLAHCEVEHQHSVNFLL